MEQEFFLVEEYQILSPCERGLGPAAGIPPSTRGGPSSLGILGGRGCFDWLASSTIPRQDRGDVSGDEFLARLGQVS